MKGDRIRPTLPAIPASPRRRSLASAALVVMAGSALSAVLGFGRDIASAHYYGTRSEMDAFLNASTVPIILFGIFQGSLTSALVPIFSEYASLHRADELKRLASTVINGLLAVMAVLAALGWLFAPVFVPVVAHGFPPAEQNLEIQMVRWLMPSVIASSLSGVFGALLNANHLFLGSSLTGIATNIVTIVFVVFLHPELGIFALVLGSLLGVFAQLLVQAPSILRSDLYGLEFDLRHPGLAKAWALFVPATLGVGAFQVNLAFDRYFASTLHAGSTAGLGYATKVAFLPTTIIAIAIGTVIYPQIAGQFAKSDRDGIRRSVSLAVRMVSFIVIPCAAILVALAYPIMQTLFQRGAFGPDSTALCASLVPWACLPLIATSYNSIMGRACYACKEVRMAVTNSFCVVAINIALSATLLPYLGARGLLLANGVALLFGTIFLTALLWRSVSGFDWKPLVSSLARILLASVVMAGALFWIRSLGIVPAAALMPRIAYLTTLLAFGLVLYLIISRALRIEELDIVSKLLMQKFTRRSAIDKTTSRALIK